MNTIDPENLEQSANLNLKHNKRKRIILISTVFCSLILALYFYFGLFHISKNFHELTSLTNLPEPLQTICENQTVTVSGLDYTAEIQYKASYSIYGRVVAKKYYLPTSAKNKLSEYDLGLTWGMLSDPSHDNDISYKHEQERRLTVRASQSLVAKLGGSTGLTRSLSNNHLLHSNEDILKALRNVQLNDYIHIEGYLVYVNIYYNNSSSYYVWNSSLSRTDSGDGGCEIIYVTNITWLKELIT